MMSPVAFEIFNLQIHWYGIVYALGFLLSYVFIIKNTKHTNLEKEKQENIFLSFMVFSVIGGRIFEIIFYDLTYYLQNPLKVFAVWQGGMSIHGGILFGFLTLYYYSRKYKANLLKLTDLYVIPASLALAFGRLANFVNQELVGKITSSKLGVVFPLYDNNTRWPTTLFESFKNLITFQILFYQFTFKKLKPGIITATFLILYNILRFFIDFLREPAVSLGIISMGQLLSLIFGIAGIILYIKIK